MTEIDPGVVLTEHAYRTNRSFAESCASFPLLARAYHRGELVPDPANSGREMLLPVRRHYSELSTAEQHKHLPQRGTRLRKLGPDEQPPLGATLLHKLAAAEAGGGVFVVEAV